jgi:MarR family transcriptional regulator, transcriptional regulator for hemolysin
MPLDHDFEKSIGFWLVSASNEYQRAVNEELVPQGITFRQCQVLGLLALDGPATQTHLADRIGIEPPTLVGILDRMERDGWIHRISDPHDGRKKIVHPTPAAEPVWSKILACGKRVRARATSGLSPDQVALLIDLLRIVKENLVHEHEPVEIH